MPLVMCIFTTLSIVGFQAGFWKYYLRTYLVSVVLSVPVSMLVIPVLTKGFQRIFITETEEDGKTPK